MKLHRLISLAGISTALFLSSCCKQDVRYVNGIDSQPKVSDEAPSDHKVIGQYSNLVVNGEIIQSDWNQGDEILLSNLNIDKLYKFTSLSSGNKIEFSGNALLNPNDKIIAFYPYRSVESHQDLYKISLPYIIEQSSLNPQGLSATNYMVASGIVNENKGLDLKFKRLVSILDIKVQNISPKESFYLDSLILTSSKAVFPKSITFNQEGDITSFSDDKVDSIVFDLKGQTLAKDEVIDIAANILPTTNGVLTTIKGNENVNFVLKARIGDKKYDMTIYKGKMSGLPLSGFSESNNNIFPDRYYSMTYEALYEDIPSSGFRVEEVDGAKSVTIYNAKGLKGFADALNDASADAALKSATILLNRGLSKIDMQGIDWMPIKEFNGTFDANGLVIENLNIKKDGDNSAFIISSKATISNLTIKNATVENADNVSVFANELTSGKFENCVVDGAEISGNSGFISGFVGKVSNDAVIKDCRVIGDVNITAQGSGNGVGGLVANAIGTSAIKGCYTLDGVNISLANVSKGVGGLVGILGTSIPLTSSYTKATVHVLAGAGHIGGLVGQLVSQAKDITGCYAAGTIRLERAVSGSSVGGVVGTRWAGGGTWEIYRGVYSTTTIEGEDGNIVGAVQGKVQGGANQTSLSTFYIQSIRPVGERNVAGLTKVTVDELKGKISDMNQHLAGSGYVFTTDGATDSEPLKIVKTIE